MSKIYSLWQEVLAWLVAPVCAPNRLEKLSSTEWADLPIYHPTRDFGACGC